jgi:hypothetical protein
MSGITIKTSATFNNDIEFKASNPTTNENDKKKAEITYLDGVSSTSAFNYTYIQDYTCLNMSVTNQYEKQSAIQLINYNSTSTSSVQNAFIPIRSANNTLNNYNMAKYTLGLNYNKEDNTGGLKYNYRWDRLYALNTENIVSDTLLKTNKQKFGENNISYDNIRYLYEHIDVYKANIKSDINDSNSEPAFTIIAQELEEAISGTSNTNLDFLIEESNDEKIFDSALGTSGEYRNVKTLCPNNINYMNTYMIKTLLNDPIINGSFTLRDNSTNKTQLLNINSSGAFEFGADSTGYGITGQILQSQGNSASPEWKNYTLSELNDTTITTPSNNDILVYNTTNGVWQNTNNLILSGTSTITGQFNTSGVTNLVTNAYKFESSGATFSQVLNANGGISITNSNLEVLNGTNSIFKVDNSNGVISFNNQAGTAGQVLQSNGSSSPPTWTSITSTATYTAGTGLSLTGTEFSNTAPDQTVTLTGSGATSISGTYPNFTISSTDTTYTAGTGLSLTGTEFANTAPDQTVTLTGSGATSISGTYPNFTISSTDNNTTYTAGTGLSLTGTEFSNTAPDQTVTLTGSGATSISGTYPNFTISSTDTTYTAGTGLSLTGTEFANTAPDQTVTLTGSGATSISGTYPNFTISSTDNNTTYTAGTGLSLTGTEFVNTAPDQTVTLTGSGATSISGTYPNFTISSTDTTYTAGTGVTLSGTQFSIGQAVGTTNNVTFNEIYTNGGISINEQLNYTDTTSLGSETVSRINGSLDGTDGGQIQILTKPDTSGSSLINRFQINNSGAVAFNSQYGSSGQVLQSNDSENPPTWTSSLNLTSGTITSSYNVTDGRIMNMGSGNSVYAEIGNAFIGYSGNTSVSFGHKAFRTTTSYGFSQGSNGDSFVNCVANQAIYFNNGGVNKMSLSTSALSVSGITLNMNTNRIILFYHDGSFTSFIRGFRNPPGYAGYGCIDFAASWGEVSMQIAVNGAGNNRTTYLKFKNGIVQTSYAPLTSSDDRFKHNEVIINNSLDVIRKLTPKKYQKTSVMYDADYQGEIKDDWVYETGLISQEILNIDELEYCVVKTTGIVDPNGSPQDEYYSLKYQDIFVYGLAATKELDTIVQNQQTDINTLNTKISNLETENTLLKQENTLIKSKLNEILTEMGKETI